MSRGRYVLLLNTDAFVATDTLRRTVAYMDANPACGVLGTRLVGRDDELQPGCRYFPNPWNVFLHRAGVARFFPKVRMVDEPMDDLSTPRECDWVPGCYMLVRKDVIDRCGLFDPRYFLYVEEVDFCRRAKSAGWKVVYFPETSVVHVGGESAKSEAKLSSSGQISKPADRERAALLPQAFRLAWRRCPCRPLMARGCRPGAEVGGQGRGRSRIAAGSRARTRDRFIVLEDPHRIGVDPIGRSRCASPCSGAATSPTCTG